MFCAGACRGCRPSKRDHRSRLTITVSRLKIWPPSLGFLLATRQDAHVLCARSSRNLSSPPWDLARHRGAHDSHSAKRASARAAPNLNPGSTDRKGKSGVSVHASGVGSSPPRRFAGCLAARCRQAERGRARRSLDRSFQRKCSSLDRAPHCRAGAQRSIFREPFNRGCEEAGSCGETTMPVSPSAMASAFPPTSVTTIGRPAAIPWRIASGAFR